LSFFEGFSPKSLLSFFEQEARDFEQYQVQKREEKSSNHSTTTTIKVSFLSTVKFVVISISDFFLPFPIHPNFREHIFYPNKLQ
jgi:hypothetical protein